MHIYPFSSLQQNETFIHKNIYKQFANEVDRHRDFIKENSVRKHRTDPWLGRFLALAGQFSVSVLGRAQECNRRGGPRLGSEDTQVPV